MLSDLHWQAVLNRDRNYDGVIIYGVVTTKIYCVPSCPSRKPKRCNAILFETYVAAERAGFRACKRCLPQRDVPIQPKIELIERVCREIEDNIEQPITLAYLARKFNLSTAYLQRTFKGVVGITPQQYREISRLLKFKLCLRQEAIAQAIYRAGYSSSSSLYENISAKLGMTPKKYQQHGAGTKITYSIVNCDLGYLLVATTEKGICTVELGDRPEELVENLAREFKRATLIRDDLQHREWIEKILESIRGTDLDLPLDIRGTAFQQQVWQALQNIPYGETRTYREIANELGKSKATRAIGNACGANPIALVIPCHRVMRSDGSLGGYRWGVERKQQLIEIEQQKTSQPDKIT